MVIYDYYDVSHNNTYREKTGKDNDSRQRNWSAYIWLYVNMWCEILYELGVFVNDLLGRPMLKRYL